MILTTQDEETSIEEILAQGAHSALQRPSLLQLFPRKGGGKGGGSSGGGGRRGGSGGGGGKGGIEIQHNGRSRTGRSNSDGGGPVVIITQGQPFAGHSEGGGTRKDVFGSIKYGSGYHDGNDNPGVAGRNFPFTFWPVIWVNAFMPYLNATEYGLPSSSIRPGGQLVSASFKAPDGVQVFRIITDNTTLIALNDSLTASCSTSYLDMSLSEPVAPINDMSISGVPQLEQVLNYYRASSVALTLDSYNNTASMLAYYRTPSEPVPPGQGNDSHLLICINDTINNSVILFDTGFTNLNVPSLALLVVMFSFIHVLHHFSMH